MNKKKMEKVITRPLWGISGYIEGLIFLLHICYHRCELKLIWIERLKHILHKVSLTYIHNEAASGCTSQCEITVLGLGSMATDSSWREVIMPGDVTCVIPFKITYTCACVYLCQPIDTP